MDQYYFESGYFTPENYFGTLYDAVVDMRPYVEDYVGEDYVENPGVQTTFTCDLTQVVVVIVEASADLTASTTVSAVASRTITGASAMNSAFEQTAVISHIEGADLFAMSNASLAADVARIRDNNIDVASAFSQVVSGAKFMYVGSDQSAEFAITADNLRVRFNEAAIDAAFSLTSNVDMVPGGEIVEASGTWTCDTLVDAKITRKQNLIDCDVTAEFTQTVTAERLAGLASIFDVVAFTTTTGPDRIRDVNASLDSAFVQSSLNDKIVQLETALESTTSMTTVSGNVEEGLAELASTTDTSATAINLGVLASDLTATSELAATISHIEGADLTAFTNTSLTALVEATREVAAVLESTTSIAADISHTESASASMSSTTSQTALAIIVTDISLALTATFELAATISHIEGADLTAFSATTLTAQAEVTRELAGDLFVTAEQTTEALRLQEGSIALDSVVTASIAGNKIRYGASSLTSEFTQAVDGNKISLLYAWTVDPGQGSYTFDSTKRTQPTGSGASIKFSANSDYQVLQGAPISDPNITLARTFWDAGTNNHCIEFWFAGTNKSNPTASFTPPQWYTTEGDWVILDTYGYRLRYSSTNGFTLSVTGKDNVTYTASTVQDSSLRVNYTLAHIAIVRSGTTVQLFVNGTRCRSATLPSNYDIKATTGFIFNGLNDYYYNVDEFRYSIGSNRYATGSNFTAPTAAYTTDQYTRALSHFNSNEAINGRVFAQATVSTVSSISVTANKFGTVLADADLTSTTAVSAQLTRQQYAAADLQVQAFTVTANGRIVPEQASLESAFFLTAELSKIKNAQSAIDSTTTVSLSAKRIRGVNSALTNTSSLTAEGRIAFRNTSAALTSSFTVSADVKEITDTPIINNIRSLLHFDGDLVDAVKNTGITVNTAPTYATGATNFGQEAVAPSIRIYRPEEGIGNTVIGNATQWSADVRVKPEVTGLENAYTTMFKLHAYSGVNDYFFSVKYIFLTSTSIRFDFVYNGSGAGIGYSHTTTYTSGQRYHISLRRNASAYSFYIDGVLGQTDTYTGSLFAPLSGEIDIGIGTFNENTFRGAIDEFRLIIGPYIDESISSPYTFRQAYTREAIANPSSNVTVSADVDKIKRAAATLTSSVSMSTVNKRYRGITKALAATATLSVTALKAATLDASMSTAVSANIAAVKTTDVISNQQVTTTQQTTNVRVRYADSNITSTSSLTANAIKTARTDSQLTVTAQQATEVLKIQTSSVELLAFASELAGVVKIGQGLIHMDSVATAAVEVIKTTDILSNLQATAEMVTNNVFLKNVTADLASESTVTAAVDKIKRIEVNAESTSDLTADADVTRTLTSQQQATTSLVADNVRTRSTQVQTTVTASLSLDITVLVEYQASLTSQATTIATAYNLVSGTSTMSAFDTMLTVGTRVRFDPYYTLQIKSESRALVIHEETRVLDVESETRVNIIKGRE